MHQATRKMPAVAKMYASHVPFPASVYTKGTVTNGVSVGQAPEMDCASVSSDDKDSFRRPYPAAFACFFGAPCTTREDLPAPTISVRSGATRLYKAGSALLEANGFCGGVTDHPSG